MAEGKVAPPIVPGEITVEAVSKSYGALEFRKDVVQDCSFRIERAKLTVMIGPSGCGKSTLIRAINGLIPHAYPGEIGGTVLVEGRPTTEIYTLSLHDALPISCRSPRARSSR